MNWSWNLLQPWQWGLLLAVPPAIVLLYFLKLRREPLEVPSTYLWHRTVEDMHVNSIWQRLRQNLLLFLQLLLILLAIIACLNPNWRGISLADDRLIFLIDHSASMAATDIAPNRLEDAKRQVAAMIDEMKSDDTAMIISFSDRAATVQSYTDNRRLLKRKLQQIQPTDRTSDLAQALRFAAGLANPGRSAYSDGDAAAADAMPARLFILSDGKVKSQSQFSLGNLDPTYIPIGSDDAKNVGITAFQARRNPERPSEMQALASLRNYSDTPVTTELSLHLDDNLIDATSLAIGPHSQDGVVFSLTHAESGVLRLEVTNGDALDVDNQAYAVLDVTQRARLLMVTPGNSFLELALTTDRMKKFADVQIAKPEYLQTDAFRKAAAEGTHNVVIFDQCAPEGPASMPLSNTVFFGALPPDRWEGGETQARPYIIDTDRGHPLMQFVELTNLLVAECIPLRPPKGAIDLVEADVGPIMSIADRDSFQDLVIGFGLIGRDDGDNEFFNTLWPREPTFPVFMQNVLSYLGGVSEQNSTEIYKPGDLMQLRLDTPSKRLSLTVPDGQIREVGRGRSGAFAFGSSEQVGIYEFQDPAQPAVTHRVAVNLFDEIESDIVPQPKLQIDEHVAIEASRGVERKRRELWKPLLLLALLVLVVEWYVYNRRVYV